MITTNWIDRLSEYLDGTLTPEEQSTCEAWLRSSAEGQALLQDLRRVVAKAKTLPDVPVPEAVWSSVTAGIRRSETAAVIPFDRALERPSPVRAKRWQFSPLHLATAAAVLLAAGTFIGITVRPGVTREGATRPSSGFGRLVSTQLGQRADVSYDKAVQELQIILEQNRGTMDTATVRVLESSLARIDAALAEAERALDGDPHSAYLNGHLSRIKRTKLDLLRQGASLVQAS